MSVRPLILAVTGFVVSVAACSSSSDSSVFEIEKPQAPVASVSVSLPASLTAGQTARGVAITKDATGALLTGRSITWNSSSESIASVTDSGVISAVAPGTAVVSASSEGVEGEATVAVVEPPPIAIATISVAVSPASVLIGQVAHAAATLKDATGAEIVGRTIAWQTSNSSIAAVSQSGDVTGVGSGTATISASSGGVSGASPVSVSAVPVATVSVSPGSATLAIGAKTTLSATTRDANGTTLTGRAVAWSSANPSVASVNSTSGQVTAVAAGSVTITATSETKTGTATITVNPPAPVATVSVSPASPSLLVGATVTLSATTRDSGGNILTGRGVTWSTSDASIASVNSSSGLVTAAGAGTATITATSEGKTGTASVTVTDPPPPPPPGSGNEPSGMSLLIDRPFNSLTEDASWLTSGLSIAQDASAPKSPSGVIRGTYPTGFVGGSGPGYAEKPHNGSRVLYISYWAKLSSNWWGHLTGVNKQFYEWADGKPMFFLDAHGVGTGGLTPEVTLQGTLSDAVYSPNLVPSARIPRGQWYHIEILLTGNTSGSTNGAVDWWLDGVHVGSITSGVRYTSGTTSWNEFAFRPVWGGLTDVVPATMTLDLDQLYVSGKN